uniref:Intercellular adhesion molecule N-terminal domain-containing protein n=1 Tax=Anas platyrhynchos platyrhynchos TaxID=8840 RepID=A0A493T8P5_ANAPP
GSQFGARKSCSGFWGPGFGSGLPVWFLAPSLVRGPSLPRVAVVPFGDSVAINCSHSGCSDPNTTLGLETSLTKNATEGGSSWQKFVLVNVSEWNPQPALCYATCGERCTAPATVLVYRVPERVVLEPVSPAAVGESRNLTCRVAEAAPLANLTVTLRRGGETLCTRNFGAAASSTSVVVRHLLTLEPEDHGQDVTCCFNLCRRPGWRRPLAPRPPSGCRHRNAGWGRAAAPSRRWGPAAPRHGTPR